MGSRFQRIYKAWLKQADGLNANTAFPLAGIGKSTSYDYATGASEPTDHKIPFFAKLMNVPESRLRNAIKADRAERANVKER